MKAPGFALFECAIGRCGIAWNGDGVVALSLPEARSVNPITGKDWEGVGVLPDVRVDAERALDEALKLARGS